MSGGTPGVFSLSALLLLSAIVILSAWNLMRNGQHHKAGSASRKRRGIFRFWEFLLRLVSRTPNFGAFAAGFSSFLLPCGQLYLFVAAALATGRAANGAAVLALFWIGTLPSFVIGPVVIKRWLGPLAIRAPKAAATLLIVAGLSSVFLFVRNLGVAQITTNGAAHVPKQGHKPHCH